MLCCKLFLFIFQELVHGPFSIGDEEIHIAIASRSIKFGFHKGKLALCGCGYNLF
jgi:hypothetical protein